MAANSERDRQRINISKYMCENGCKDGKTQSPLMYCNDILLKLYPQTVYKVLGHPKEPDSSAARQTDSLVGHIVAANIEPGPRKYLQLGRASRWLPPLRDDDRSGGLLLLLPLLFFLLPRRAQSLNRMGKMGQMESK